MQVRENRDIHEIVIIHVISTSIEYLNLYMVCLNWKEKRILIMFSG